MMLGKKRSIHQQSLPKTAIVDPKNQLNEQRFKQVMEIFAKQQIELLPQEDALPKAQLKKDASISAYKTDILLKYSVDFQLIWSLAVALAQKDQVSAVKKWMYELVNPGLESELERATKLYPEDPFATAFTYLSFGQRDAASEQATKSGDYTLAMHIIHSEYQENKKIILEQINTLKTTGQWSNMTVFHKKCWYVVAGNLGYVPEDELVVTGGLYWQRALGMYIWFGNHYNILSLDPYNKVFDKSIPSIHHLKTTKQTAAPDDCCLWFQLLQWWVGNEKLAHLQEWPLDLVWLLSIYKQPNTIDSQYINRWIETLENQDMAEFAICASLFSAPQKVDYILRQCEWSDEDTLINQYHIPKRQVYIAKALNAHDAWDYRTEYKCLIQVGLKDQAKLALLYFLLPKLYASDEESWSVSLSYLEQYSQPDEDIVLLKNAYNSLMSSSGDNMENLIEGLDHLKAKFDSRNAQNLFQSLKEDLRKRL